ncbi:cell envelope integrity protein TolA [Alteromonas mediterranea]|uniref:cell envelope integrity protein TolA n=1 Tax=Alteromonas mediterranea TaxID=314275 RepID=UPI002FE19D84
MTKPEVSNSTETKKASSKDDGSAGAQHKGNKASKITPEQLGLYKSLGLHAIIAAVLLISVSFSPEPLPNAPSNAPVIEATFIDAQAIADQKKAQAQAEAQARAEEREKQRKAQAAAEKKRQQQLAAKRAREKREAKAAEAKRQKELERLAAQKEQARKEREAKAKAEAERKKKEAAERAEMERIMQEQLAQEQAANSARRQQQVLSEVEKYRSLISLTINRNLYRDDNFRDKVCRLNVRLATTGFVTRVTVLSGDPALCREAESALRRVEKLPVSDDPDVYEELKDINLTVKLEL